MFPLPKNPKNIHQYVECAWTAGFRWVAGVDEVGRGPLAGPVVAAAVQLVPGCQFPCEVKDSKQLSPEEREEIYYQLVHASQCRYAIALVDVETIDQINILQATLAAMKEAVGKLSPPPDFVFVDGNQLPVLPQPALAIVKGDQKCSVIAAASILAKVYRDQLMINYEKLYPGYGFANHKGYATPEHLAAIKKLGPSPIHRKSFAPISQLSNMNKTKDLFSSWQ